MGSGSEPNTSGAPVRPDPNPRPKNRPKPRPIASLNGSRIFYRQDSKTPEE